MKLAIAAFLLAVSSLPVALPCQAQDAGPLVAQVHGLYLERGRGLLVEAASARDARGRRFADVDLGPLAGPDRRRVIVQLEDALRVEPGDLVVVTLAVAVPMALGQAKLEPVAAASRAVAAKAKWFSEEAQRFGRAGGTALASRVP
jgi:hypothetical protein